MYWKRRAIYLFKLLFVSLFLPNGFWVCRKGQSTIKTNMKIVLLAVILVQYILMLFIHSRRYYIFICFPMLILIWSYMFSPYLLCHHCRRQHAVCSSELCYFFFFSLIDCWLIRHTQACLWEVLRDVLYDDILTGYHHYLPVRHC